MYENFFGHQDTRIHIDPEVSAPSAPVFPPPCEENLMFLEMKKHCKEALKKSTYKTNVSQKTRRWLMWILCALFLICTVTSLILGFMETSIPFYIFGTMSGIALFVLIALEHIFRRLLKTRDQMVKTRELMNTMKMFPHDRNDYLAQRLFQVNRD